MRDYSRQLLRKKMHKHAYLATYDLSRVHELTASVVEHATRNALCMGPPGTPASVATFAVYRSVFGYAYHALRFGRDEVTFADR